MVLSAQRLCAASAIRRRSRQTPARPTKPDPITATCAILPSGACDDPSQCLDIGVHADRLAGYVPPCWGQEVCDCRGDVACGHHSTHRDFLEIGLFHRLVTAPL